MFDFGPELWRTAARSVEPPIQRKPTISSPGDAHECEAEPRFGHDFSRVPLHPDRTAEDVARPEGGTPCQIDIETKKLERMVAGRSQMFDTLKLLMEKYDASAKDDIRSMRR